MRKGQRIDVRNIHPLAGSALMATSGGGGMAFTRPKHYRPRDWAVKLLQLAAQVEHALMIQYLYAAYSIRPGMTVPGLTPVNTNAWMRTIAQIAKEEMGHLLTVQNLLRLTGGPLCWEREDFPIASDFYPFPFKLERFSKNTLAKYLYTEMSPDDVPASVLTPAERAEIEQRARQAAGGQVGSFLNHVGTLYNSLIEVFSTDTEFTDADLFPARLGYESADFGGFTDTDTVNLNMSIKLFAPGNRADALKALQVIARQGEAADPADLHDSHFERFRDIYRQCPDDTSALTWPVLTNPSTSSTPPESAITDGKACRWGVLFNLRYRILLSQLAHLTALPSARPDGTSLQSLRDLLIAWLLDEMHGLRDLARVLAGLPSGNGTATTGAPFEMPYTLALAEFGPERWRLHLDLLLATRDVIDDIRSKFGDDPKLAAIIVRDGDSPTADGGRWKEIVARLNNPE